MHLQVKYTYYLVNFSKNILVSSSVNGLMVQVKMRSLDWSKHVFGNRRIESCHSVQVYAKQEPTVRDNRM